MNKSQGTRLQRLLIFAALWLLSVLLMWGSSHLPNESVRILDGRGETVLEPEGTWIVPILKFPPIDALGDWPFWLFALVASLLLAIVGRQMLARGMPPAAAFVAVTGLALVVRTEHFVLAWLLFATAWLLNREMPLPRKLIALGGCFVVSLLVTIEFGFVVFFSLLILAPEFWSNSTRPVQGISLGALVLFAGVSAWLSGMVATAARPFSWAWARFPEPIFSESFAAFSPAQDWRTQLPLLIFFLYCWIALYGRIERWNQYLLPLFCLTVLGFCNVRYLWISSLMLSLTHHVPVRSEISPRIGHAVLAVALLFGLARFLPRAGGYLDFALGEDAPPVVEPAEWGIQGRVMLLDLSQSLDWQPAKTRRHFKLLMDDRWEVFHEQYEHYAAVCRDVREIRADSYLRTDQQFGGYKRWLNEWSPTLLVANSANLWDIRRLSLSPDWRVMGIDAKRTIFGYAKDPRNYRQSARALGMMTQLEWPPLAPSPWHENVMAANTPDDLLKVSRVLTALRFPYAGLRLLPDQDNPAVGLQRTWCHMEIAHRVYRHSGQGSLLDQFRAVHGLRHFLAESNDNLEDKIRAIFSIEGLDLERLANQLAWQLLETGITSSMTAEQRTRLESLQDRTSARLDAITEGVSDGSDSEAVLRQALLEGDPILARKKLDEVAEPLRGYYAVLLSSLEASPAELFDNLSAQLNKPSFPENQRGEGLFYLGCLALEAGNTEAAVSAFRESTQIAPESPFHSLRQMYRMQLGDR